MKSIKAEILIVSPSSEHIEEQLTVETSTFKLFGVGQFTISTRVMVWTSILVRNTLQWLVYHSVPTQEKKKTKEYLLSANYSRISRSLSLYQIPNPFIKKYLKEMFKFFVVLSFLTYHLLEFLQ